MTQITSTLTKEKAHSQNKKTLKKENTPNNEHREEKKGSPNRGIKK